MEQPPALPTRVAWFAPWTWLSHWPSWKRGTLAMALGLAAYLLAAAPTEYLFYRVNTPRPVYTVRRIAFEPAFFVLRNSPVAMQVFVWELRVMDALFGKALATDFSAGEQGSEDE